MAKYKVYIYTNDTFICAAIIQIQTVRGENTYRVRVIFKRKIGDGGTLEGDLEEYNGDNGEKNQAYINVLVSKNRLYSTTEYDGKSYNVLVKEVQEILGKTDNISKLQTAMQSPFHGEWRF